MEKQINQTLFNHLFETPDPLEDKRDVFFILYDRLFPDKSAFKFFLTTNNYDEQIKVSKVIIQRICFESNYPPAYDLLLNLLQYENTDENKAQTRAYTPQDHFVHIVNSYVFGIYLYFFHPVLSSKLTKYFIGARKEEENVNPVLNATKDFISFWKYFCLFHDVAYPIEGAFQYKCYDKDKEFKKCYKDKNRGEEVFVKKKSEECTKYIKAFQNIQSLNIKEWSAAAVARFLTVLDLFYDEANKKADTLFLNSKATYIIYPKTDDDTPCDIMTVRQIAADYICIDKLFSFEHFKLLSGFIRTEDTLIVIVDNYTLVPVAFKYYKNGCKKVYAINQNRYSENVDAVIDNVFEDEEDYISSRFSVRFCLKNPRERLRKITPSWGTKRLSIDEIEKIRKKISLDYSDNGLPSDSDVRFSNITAASELDDYSFGIFKIVFDYLGEEFISKSKISVYEQIIKLGTSTTFQVNLRNTLINAEAEKISNYLSDMLCREITNVIGSSIKKLIDQGDSLGIIPEKKEDFVSAFEKPITVILEDAISSLNNDKQAENVKVSAGELYDRIRERIDKQNKDSSSTIQFLSEFLLKVFNPIDNPDNNLCEKFFGTLENKKWNDLPDVSLIGCQEESKRMVDSIDEVVRKISSKTLSADKLCKEYMNPNVALDHGIWGGFVYLISAMITTISIKALFSKSGAGTNMASAIPYFIWPISKSSPNAYMIKLIRNYDLISEETAKAIFVHNIYSDFVREIPSVKNKPVKWNIDLNTEPCVFFALLVDALQKWDRRQYFSPKLDYRSLYEADSYDIQIVDKKLRITMRCHSRDINTLNNKLRESLDTYLECASELIELSFI